MMLTDVLVCLSTLENYLDEMVALSTKVEFPDDDSEKWASGS